MPVTDDPSITPANLVDALGGAIERSTAGAWHAARVVQERGLLRVSLVPSKLLLEIRKASAGTKAYKNLRGFAFSYRSEHRSLAKPTIRILDRCIAALASILEISGFDLDQDVLRSAEERDVGFPTPYQYWHLDQAFELDPEQIERYRERGHLLVRRALDPAVVRAAVPMINDILERNWPQDQLPVDERPDEYSQSFTQITHLGLKDPTLRVFSNAPRVCDLAAQLMGVESVRLFCEDWLIKEPGAKITPWHQDAAVFPFDAKATITAWIPLRDVGEGEGLLRFARGSHAHGLANIEGIHGFSQSGYTEYIEAKGFAVDRLPPVTLGDISFHDGRMIHGAFPNDSDAYRTVLALHFFAEGAPIKANPNQGMRETLRGAVPHLGPGDLAQGDLWPLVHGPEHGGPPRIQCVGAEPEPRTIEAIVLPQDRPCSITIEGGLLRVEPLADDRPRPGVYACAGLVESHGHISYPHTREDPVSELRWMNPRRLDYAETGVTLIRDMGATCDAITKLVDAPGLPRVHSCGYMIVRTGEWPFTPTEPEQLVEACVARVQAGARWVKVFADFTDDYQDRIDPGFTYRDEITYPLEILRAAVDAVHELGARLGTHCFTRVGTQVSIEAGVDSLEHGWGVDEALLDQMVERGTAWAPLMGISRTMWDIAARDGYPDRHQWLREVFALLSRTLPLAEQRGITLLAGTDQFPAITVADEIRQLHALGVSKLGALAAGTWGARAYLGEPGLQTGAPADLVVYPRDPREDLDVLDEPERILVGGKPVEASCADVRPSFEPFLPPPA